MAVVVISYCGVCCADCLTRCGWGQIVTIDPFGHCVLEAFPEHFAKGYDIRPTIAGASELQLLLFKRRDGSIVCETDASFSFSRATVQ